MIQRHPPCALLGKSRMYFSALEIIPFTSLNIVVSAWLMLSLIIHHRVFYCDLMGSITHQNGPSQQSYSPEPTTQPFFHFSNIPACTCTNSYTDWITASYQFVQKTKLSLKELTLYQLPTEFWHSDTMTTEDTLTSPWAQPILPVHSAHTPHGAWTEEKWVLWKVSSVPKSCSKQVADPGSHPQWHTWSEARRTR